MNADILTKAVMVVDDNPGDIGLFTMVFSHCDNISLLTATSISQANALLTRKPPYENVATPDLIFLDLRMPLFSGLNLLTIIKKDPQLSGIKVVVFTSSEQDSDRRSCLELGADEYLVKPRDWPEYKAALVSAVAKHCGVVATSNQSDWFP